MKTGKSIIKVIVIVISVIWLATLPLRLPALTMILANNSFSLEKDNFLNSMDAFEETIKIVQKIMEGNKNTDCFCISIEHKKNEVGLWLTSPDKGIYQLSKSEQQSIRAVESVFKDNSLDCITVQNSVISFDNIDGTYAVLFTTDCAVKNLKKDFYSKQENIKIKRIKGNWYHKKSETGSLPAIFHVLFGLYILK